MIDYALIGTGRIGTSLELDKLREKPASHAGAARQNKEVRLAAGADPDAEKLTAFGRQWRLPADCLFTDPAVMLDRVRPGIVSIAADTDAHIPLLKLALDRKIPVVILEKPVAATLAEGENTLPLVEAAEKAGTIRVIVNHERRFSADYNHALGLIRSQCFGRLLTMNGRLYMGKTRAIEKVLWHDATHMVDIIRYLAGEITVERCFGSVEPGGGNWFAIGRAGESSLVMEVSPGRDHLHFELDLSFERGRLRIGNGIFEEGESRPSPYYEHYRSLMPVSRRFKKTGYFSGMMAHAVELYHDRALPCRSSFADGLAAIRVIDGMIHASARP
jgi:predicted dehydrogenase